MGAPGTGPCSVLRGWTEGVSWLFAFNPLFRELCLSRGGCSVALTQDSLGCWASFLWAGSGKVKKFQESSDSEVIKARCPKACLVVVPRCSLASKIAPGGWVVGPCSLVRGSGLFRNHGSEHGLSSIWLQEAARSGEVRSRTSWSQSFASPPRPSPPASHPHIHCRPKRWLSSFHGY